MGKQTFKATRTQTGNNTDKEAKAFFAKLSYSNQRKHIDPINQAKSPETRARRIEKAVALFRQGKS